MRERGFQLHPLDSNDDDDDDDDDSNSSKNNNEDRGGCYPSKAVGQGR